MSGNVVRPDWPNRSDNDGGGSGGAGDDGLAARVSALETKVEILTVKLDSRSDALTERIDYLADSLKMLSVRIDAKVIGPWQMVGIFASMIGIVTAVIALLRFGGTIPR